MAQPDRERPTSGKRRALRPQSRVKIAMIGLVIVTALGMVDVVSAAPVVPPWRLGLPWTSRTATLEIGDLTVEAEVADTGPIRERGLGYRAGLNPGAGMLFVYEEPGPRSFWMKGMRFCLDIIWIESGQIVGAAESVCPVEGAADADLPVYRSPEPVRYVLEMPAGWLANNGFSAGTPVTIRLPT
jgi:uncharacterized membrane protein (UPF0127 family)